jgi:acetyl-CoA synthetase (ADP-forming)
VYTDQTKLDGGSVKEAEEIIKTAQDKGLQTLSEFDGKRLLAGYGIPVVREELVQDLPAAKEAAAEIGYPVVLKVCSPQITHKTEKGLIAVDLRREEELNHAFEALRQRAAETEGFLVQEMIRGPRELVIGLIRDPQFGPCVMFGLGGIFTEILRDVSFRVAPLEARDAAEMMQEIQGHKILEAVRGMEAVDLDLLGRSLIALGDIGLAHPAIREIDVNPMIVRGARPVAVDALVVFSEPSGS